MQVIFGKRGSGKTTLIKSQLSKIGRLMIYDVCGEYEEDTVQFVEGEFIKFVDYVEEQGQGFFHASFVPNVPQVWIPYFLKTAWMAKNLTLILDEVDQYSSPTSVPNELQRNINLGRHQGLDIIASSRRPASVPRLLTSQASKLIAFQTNEPRDLAYIEEYCGKDFAEAVRTLPTYHFLSWSGGSVEGPTMIECPRT